MDRLRVAAIVSLLSVAVVAGGVLVRLAVLVGDVRAVVSVGVVLALIAVTVRFGARSRDWWQNPYW